MIGIDWAVWGFTGTQHGMTAEQKRALAEMVLPFIGYELRHGDCVGADAEADAIARRAGWVRVAHPPASTSKRAWCKADVILEPQPYLVRNRDIVRASEILIAAPKGFTEEQRSGTWTTIRYAKSLRRPIRIIWPDGRVEPA